MTQISCPDPQEIIDRAIKCGPKIERRDWRPLTKPELSRAELNMRFIEAFLVITEGELEGKPFKLMPWQEQFIYDVFDNPHGTRRAILSIGRKNGKTVLAAAILLLFICGPEAVQGSSIAAGALGREQAGIVFKHMAQFIERSPALQSKCQVSKYQKTIEGHTSKVNFAVLAKDGGRTLGRSDLVVLGDEWGAIRSETDDFVNALTSGQGAYGSKALRLVISTQAPSDRSMLSTWIDQAERDQDPHAVVHVYAANEDADILDEREWYFANPSLGISRSMADMQEQMTQASKLPSLENSARNLLLNQRVDVDARWLASGPWGACNLHQVTPELFHNTKVVMGLDLSSKNDLTCACLAARDEDGIVHLMPFTFTPASTLAERELKDKAPYSAWVRSGDLIATPGPTIGYEYVAGWLRKRTEELGISVSEIAFDRWRADIFRAACDREGAFTYSAWSEVGQGFKDLSPRCENFETLILNKQLNHGGAPLLTMAAANAIAVRDPSNNVKVDKARSTAKIDPIVAALMAAWGVSNGQTDETPSDLSYLVA